MVIKLLKILFIVYVILATVLFAFLILLNNGVLNPPKFLIDEYTHGVMDGQ